MIRLAQPRIDAAGKRAVLSVLESGQLAQGCWVSRLEERFAALCQVRHAVAVSSGTAALHLALLAHGIGAGDEVITTPFTFIATVNAILMTGARPVFVDVDESTFNLDPRLIPAAVTSRSRAILPVHLFGLPAELGVIREIAEARGLALIEDASQAVGATYRSRPVGSLDTGCFSLYATKNLAAGEGGLITTNDDTVADRCRLLRNHGMRKRYHYELLGFNQRLSEIPAAIALSQLDRLDNLTARRRANARYLNQRVKTVVTSREPPAEFGHVWHQYTVRFKDVAVRQRAIERLSAAGIETAIFYPQPVHQIDHIRQVVGPLSLPVAERLAGQVLSLPVHPGLTRADRARVAAEVNRL